ncbi:hypothetical protein WA556_001764 [Blastocystis sp. ATCC 50177/Nand II]
MAAALNWVLKDGLGQLGGMAFTALVNSRLDADSRGWRILAAWLLEISTWLEVLTPLCPRYFLLFATLANIGKNISWLAGSATRAGIRYGFVNAHNMGDLTAKEGSQTVAITVFGTFLGIMLSNLIGPGHMEYVLLSSLCISSISLFSIYRSLHCVSLPTLNYQVIVEMEIEEKRGEIVTRHYMSTGTVLEPTSVAGMERYYLPYLKVKGGKKEELIPVVMGVSLLTTLSVTKNYKEVEAFLELFKDEHYILSYCPYKQGVFRSIVNREKRKKNVIGVTLKEDATPEDQLKAYYHAHMLRKHCCEVDARDMKMDDQLQFIKESFSEVNVGFSAFRDALEKAGWNCTDLFLEEVNHRYCK